MDTIYIAVQYQDDEDMQTFSLLMAFTHLEQARKYVLSLGLNMDSLPQYQDKPVGSILDASLISDGKTRISIMPCKFRVGTDIVSNPVISMPEAVSTTSTTSMRHTMELPVTNQMRSNIPIPQRSIPVSQTGNIPTASTASSTLNIQDGGNTWNISGGRSYIKRTLIKEMGGKWNNTYRVWMVPKANTTVEQLRNLFG